jgi:hypothetical protein
MIMTYRTVPWPTMLTSANNAMQTSARAVYIIQCAAVRLFYSAATVVVHVENIRAMSTASQLPYRLILRQE